mmetsp:Transcript_43351/g.52465  ORF Transcript_43351/g.52465 Transcript_43351/m.52465 type:complete len:154 (-) Transcript_43351:447-908(-)|eukprot:CAMPEP_0197848586 /NCGR_PEP_ID=MMETSP1438-20131217/9205_1 /TAXON_ID=1461541 /ORGANISM="Pterosperma sp., Strain CCMP1384" /LENGTH=153 /DNA_ID=CAMNT_0043460909 /DNA_START=80 /DNA_END=541 /DNA_ORIENTATION=+
MSSETNDKFDYGSGRSVLGQLNDNEAAPVAVEVPEDAAPPALDQLKDLGGQVSECLSRLDKVAKSLKSAPLPTPENAASMRAKAHATKEVQLGMERVADVEAKIAMIKHELEQRQVKQQGEKARFQEWKQSMDRSEKHIAAMEHIAANLEFEE